jgi:4-diphosphocytidyl-2-C-methyl-D-erythritol kinase
VKAEAAAKVNLSLRVRSADRQGRHPLLSVAQSVSWYDSLEMEASEEDTLDALGAPVPLGEANLVWKAINALRGAGHRLPVQVRLDKRIPMAAGLGGGSADAAAALTLYARLTGFPADGLAAVAAQLGADVPMCLEGGFVLMEGFGERLNRLGPVGDDYWLAIAVPPFELRTGDVYARWDRLAGPSGPPVGGRHLPPSLRSHGPLRNDLYPAAASLVPELDDWCRELEAGWDRPVLSSGSGPSLFAFFLGEEEAVAALAEVPDSVRARRAVAPVPRGVTVS